MLDICFFCFAGLILEDCLELSCLLLVFHKCNSKNNEIHKKPILYECKLWLLIDKTIKQSLYRRLGLCLLFSWEACFACGTIFDLRLQDIMQDKSIYASCKTWNCIYTEGEPNGLDLFPNLSFVARIGSEMKLSLNEKDYNIWA